MTQLPTLRLLWIAFSGSPACPVGPDAHLSNSRRFHKTLRITKSFQRLLSPLSTPGEFQDFLTSYLLISEQRGVPPTIQDSVNPSNLEFLD